MSKPDQFITSDILTKYSPLNYLTPSETELLAQKVNVKSAQPGTLISEIGSTDEHALYLLDGKIKVESSDGQLDIISSDSERAIQPISCLTPHRIKITSVTAVEYFLVDNFIVDNLSERDRSSKNINDIGQPSDHLANNKLFQAIYNDLHKDKLVLPTLPEIVLRVRSIIDEQDSVSQLKAIIQSDPAIAATIMKVANCAIYRTYNPVKTLEQAIMRMGLTPTKNYVVSYAMRDIFKTRSPYIRRRMVNVWNHSTEVAAIAYMLAGKLKQFDAEYAMLLGLLHDIGMIPILNYAESHSHLVNNNEMLDETLTQLHGELGSLMFTKWKFAPEYAKVAAESDDWYRDYDTQPDYCDLVLVAQLHGFLTKSSDDPDNANVHKELPDISRIQAIKKLGLEKVSVEHGVDILNSVEQEIYTIKNVLRAA